MSVINTNISATLAANALAKNERSMTTSMERLSTGLRINSAKDDAAGLAISARMTGQVRGLEQAARNANDAISMLQVAEGATQEISNMLIRMRELAVQAANGTYSATDRDALNLEFGELMSEIDRIAKNTQWNGMSILDGDGQHDETTADTSVTVQLGPSASQTMTVTLKSWVPTMAVDADATDAAGTASDGAEATANGDSAFGDTAILYWGGVPTRIGIDTADEATFAITQLDRAINGATAERAQYGAYISRLEHASDNLLNVAQNTDASRSRIQDADYAKETTELARNQIIAQAGTAMLAQANQVKQTVLSLLQ
ncbi:MAG: flagellin [Proteobacteria bacterium]|jgi:flagellin|nr:flagellin [Pseudomonadota bacterium]MDA0928074.1 flagellin [Pseudomonadota bacterium]